MKNGFFWLWKERAGCKKDKKNETNASNVPVVVDSNFARSTNGTGVVSSADESVVGLGPFPRMLDGKLVLLGDDGKPLKPSRLTQVEPSPHEEAVGLDTGTGHFEAPNSCVGGAEVMASSSGEVNKDSFVSTKECKIDEATRVACESFDAAMNEAIRGCLRLISDWVKMHDIPIVAFTKDRLSAMATRLADRELKDNMVIAISNLEGNGDVLRMFKSTKQEYQPIFKKNGASTSGTTNNSKTTRPMKSTSNPFDAHKKVENDDELGENRSISNTVDNVANHPYVATSSLGMNRERVGLVKGKNKENDLANKESESDVEELYNKTTSFMAFKSGRGEGRKSLYERWKDDYDDNSYDEDMSEDLTKY
ncbi:hypothetical protein Tco_0572654 [Tanacetum coccineum]